jgi:hypothetical protein
MFSIAACQKPLVIILSVSTTVLSLMVSSAPAGPLTFTIADECKIAVPDVLATKTLARSPSFSTVEGFSLPSSLYETYWRIEAIRTSPFRAELKNHLDVSRISEGIVTDLARDIRSNQDGVGPLNLIYYAASLLPKSMDHVVRPIAIEELHKLDAGDQYRSSPMGPTSWGATLLATQIAKRLGVTISLPSYDFAWRHYVESLHAKSEVARENRLSILGYIQFQYPRMVESDFTAFRDEVTRDWAALRVSTVSPFHLLDWSEVRSLSNQLNVKLSPPFQMKRLSAAVATNGEILGNPQATYYAEQSGFILSHESVAKMYTGLLPKGWIDLEAPPTATSDYESVVILRQCGVANSVSIAQEMSKDALTELESSGHLSELSAPNTLATLSLIGLDHSILPSKVRERLNAYISGQVAKVSRTKNLGGFIDLLDLLASVRGRKVSLDRVATASLMNFCDRSISGSYDVPQLVDRLSCSRSISHAAKILILRGAPRSGVISIENRVPPDLITTTVVAESLGNFRASNEALKYFSTNAGPVLQKSHSANVTLDSIFYAVELAEGSSEIAPIAYF